MYSLAKMDFGFLVYEKEVGDIYSGRWLLTINEDMFEVPSTLPSTRWPSINASSLFLQITVIALLVQLEVPERDP